MTYSVDVHEGLKSRRSLQEIQASLTKARQDKQLSLDEPSAKRLLTHFGIAVPRATFLADSVSADMIEVALADLRPPYVLKVVSADILHKSDSGGVKLGLTSAQALRLCRLRLPLYKKQLQRAHGWVGAQASISIGAQLVTLGGV